jgi:ABC-2 type transport system ATP-binding protein
VISVSGLTRYYGELCAVNGLSFDVAPGEILGLVGENGAGKTTALHCVAGILQPTSGSVTVAGINMAREPVKAKGCLSFIPDTPLLFDYMTVMEHLQFVARVFQVEDWRGRAKDLLDEFELTEKQDQLPDALSRGMRQKLAICQAFLHGPKVVLCDEPLTGLDPRGIRNMRASLKRRADDGAGLILSSHQLELVSAMCDRVLIVRNGEALITGTIDEIRARYPALGEDATLEEVFLHAMGDGAGSAVSGDPPSAVS